MNQSGTNRVRTIVNTIFSFMLCLMISGIIFVVVISLTAINVRYLDYSIEKSRYKDGCYDDIAALLEKEAASRNLPDNVLSGTLDKNKFKDDLSENIILANQGFKTVAGFSNYDTFADTVRMEMGSYLKDNQVGSNRWVEAAVEEVVGVSSNYYQKYSDFPFGRSVVEYKNAVSDLFKLLVAFFITIAVLLAVVIFKLQPDIYQGWQYISNSLLASALISIAFGITVYFKIDYSFPRNVNAYESFVNLFFDEIGAIFIMCGVSLFVLSIVGALIINKYEEKQEINKV